MSDNNTHSKRVELIDLWRSVAIVCMIIYHFLYDLALFGIISWQQFFSAPMNAFQRFICCSFIIVSGISARFSRSNIKRGFITLLCSLVITAVSLIIKMPILFGILSFLGSAMLIYGLLRKNIDKIPGIILPAFSLLLFFITDRLLDGLTVQTKLLFPLGLIYPGFSSADYFPIFPWIFLFLFGTWLGGIIKKCEAKWLYTELPTPLTFLGRHSLLIYMLHQPILYGIAMLLS